MTLDKIISNRVKGWSDAAHLREEILSWFKEQLPKKKEEKIQNNAYLEGAEYNQCLQDILTNLTAKQGER